MEKIQRLNVNQTIKSNKNILENSCNSILALDSARRAPAVQKFLFLI